MCAAASRWHRGDSCAPSGAAGAGSGSACVHPLQLPFQRRALTWMLMREGSVPWPSAYSEVHPLWQERTTEHGTTFYLNPWTGAIRVAPPVRGPQCRGGVLADEMGLGKTVRPLSHAHGWRPVPRSRVPTLAAAVADRPTVASAQVELLGLILAHPRPPLDPARDGVDEHGYFTADEGGYRGDGPLHTSHLLHRRRGPPEPKLTRRTSKAGRHGASGP